MTKVFACPLAEGKIDSDFCLEIQECVDGITEPTIEYGRVSGDRGLRKDLRGMQVSSLMNH